jgi:GTP pyrophosphokinase
VAIRFERVGLEYSEEKVKRAASRLAHKTLEDVLAAVGRGELPVNDVVKAVSPEAAAKLEGETSAGPKPRNRHDHAQGQEGWFNLSKVMNLKFRMPDADGKSGKPSNGAGADLPGPTNGGVLGVPIRGARGDLPVLFKDGGAVPGDRIVGVLVPGEGIHVHQIHSPTLAQFEQADWVDVTWDIDPDRPERFPAKLGVTVVNEPGTLAQIAQVIGEADGNIDNLRMVRRAADFTEMHLEVEVWDLEHLNRIIRGLKSKASVALVERTFG